MLLHSVPIISCKAGHRTNDILSSCFYAGISPFHISKIPNFKDQCLKKETNTITEIMILTCISILLSFCKASFSCFFEMNTPEDKGGCLLALMWPSLCWTMDQQLLSVIFLFGKADMWSCLHPSLFKITQEIILNFDALQKCLSVLHLNLLQYPEKYTTGLIKLCVQSAFRCTKTNKIV